MVVPVKKRPLPVSDKKHPAYDEIKRKGMIGEYGSWMKNKKIQHLHTY